MAKCQHSGCDRVADVMFGNGTFTEYKCMEHALADDPADPGHEQPAAADIN